VSDVNVLFLDDMKSRHATFGRLVDEMSGVCLWRAHTAAEAIQLLMSETRFGQVFLDHDLSEEDIMVRVGERSRVPTGMTVVDHILTMPDPPREVFVHTCNPDAGDEMVRRLQTHPAGIVVHRFPFPMLIQLMERR
jgi:hypothetical protein